MTAPTLTLEDGPIGAAISNVDLTGDIPDTVFSESEHTIAERAVVVVRDQVDLPSAALVIFARRFGTPQVNVRAEANNDANPEIFWVSNVNENGKPRFAIFIDVGYPCLLYTSPSPRDATLSRMPSSA